MMDKMNFNDVVKSFFLGMFIGFVLLWFSPAPLDVKEAVTTVLSSSSIGFIVGLLTEWVTAQLPISMAKKWVYFAVNNTVALLVTLLIMSVLFFMMPKERLGIREALPILMMILVLVSAGNLVDILAFKKSNKQLEAYKTHVQNNLKKN